MLVKKHYHLFVFFILGGLFTGAMAYFVQGNAFGFTNVTLLAVTPAFFVGAIAAIIISSLVSRTQEKLRTAHDHLEEEAENRAIELQERNALLNTVLGASPNVIAITQISDGKIKYCNEATTGILGYEVADVIGRKSPDFYDDPKERGVLLKKIQTDGFVRDHKVALKKADGSPVWTLFNAKIVTIEGEPHLVTEITDLTERQNTENELNAKVKELDFQKYALDEHAIVSITDVKGDITYANDKFCEISGYSREELLGQNHRILKSDEHSPEFYDDLWRSIAKGKPWHGEIKNIKKSGGYYWVKATIVAFLNERGKPFQYVAIRTDITKSKQSIEALDESSKQLSHAIEVANLCHWRADATMTQWLETSENTRKIIGFPTLDVLGAYENYLSRVHPDDHDTLVASYAAISRDPQAYDLEYRVIGDDGEVRYLWEMAEPEYDNEGNIVCYRGMTQNISARKIAEFEAIQAKDEAQQANRTKSDFLSAMSHELRTPLNAIIGFSETMKQETFGPVGSDKNREYLDDIHQSGQHLLELINDILDASAIEAGALELHEENVNLTDVIEASIRLITPRAKNGMVNVSSSLDPDIPLIYADPRRVKQVILNLLSNAVKFTQEGGEVSVSSWLNDDGSVAIATDDTGVGMNAKEIEKALSKFGQVDSGLDRKHEGTGLGLPLTTGLMERHGGTLEIKSKKGHGTLVTVTFPKERAVLTPRNVPL